MTQISTIKYTELFSFLERFTVFEPFGYKILDLGALIHNDHLYLYYDSELDTEITSQTQEYYVSYKSELDKYMSYNSNMDLMQLCCKCMDLTNNLIDNYKTWNN